MSSNSRILAMMYKRPDNAINNDKTQLAARDCYSADKRLPKKFCHPDDIKAGAARTLERKREARRNDLLSEPNRIYAVIGEIPGGGDAPGMGGPQTGEVTQPSNSRIVWDRVTQRWVAATCLATATPPINATVRMVQAGRRTAFSRQGGGK